MLRQQKHLIHHKQLSEAPSNNRQYSSVTYILTQSLLDVGATHSTPVTWPMAFSMFLGVPSLSPSFAWFLLLKPLPGDNPKSRVTQQMCRSFCCFPGFCMCLSVSIYGMLFCYLSSDVLYYIFSLLCPNLNELLVLRKRKKKFFYPWIQMQVCVICCM